MPKRYVTLWYSKVKLATSWYDIRHACVRKWAVYFAVVCMPEAAAMKV
jgi:hypothetical protein